MRCRTHFRTVDTAQGAALFGNLNEIPTQGAAKELLDGMRGVFGFIPNLGYALAIELSVLEAYIVMLKSLSATSLDPIAQQQRWSPPAKPMQ